jgi:hypothetical protein
MTALQAKTWRHRSWAPQTVVAMLATAHHKDEQFNLPFMMMMNAATTATSIPKCNHFLSHETAARKHEHNSSRAVVRSDHHSEN